ncbi:hypothetical protein NSTCB13_03128 [Nostoc sp. DSM 114160]|jgi:hypothetical protein
MRLQIQEMENYTNSINDCNTYLGKDAMNRVSTNGLFVVFFFQIGINLNLTPFNYELLLISIANSLALVQGLPNSKQFCPLH